MLHTVFCKIFTLHWRPQQQCWEWCIYRNRRGILGKSRGLSCSKSKVIFLKFSRRIRTAIRPPSSQVRSRKLCGFKTIAVNFKLQLRFKNQLRGRGKSQKVKGRTPAPPRLCQTAGLAKCSGCEPATTTTQVSCWETHFLQYNKTPPRPPRLSLLHSLTEVHLVWVIRLWKDQTSGMPINNCLPLLLWPLRLRSAVK